MITLASWFVKITGWILSVIAFRKKVYYEDRSIQGRHIKGKAIVISNHTSVFDFALMLYLFPTRTLRCQVAEIMYEKNFFLTFTLKILGSIKVNRHTHDFSFIEKSKKVLSRGGVLTVFPESRIPDDVPKEKRPIEFKPSFVSIALESDAPIIPIYTNGSYFGHGRTRVMIGTPIDVREMYDPNLTENENLELISEKLREKVVSLKNELQKRTEKN
jgi:1-acyl-sn-glycerol-3-phosphate acyltransferase